MQTRPKDSLVPFFASPCVLRRIKFVPPPAREANLHNMLLLHTACMSLPVCAEPCTCCVRVQRLNSFFAAPAWRLSAVCVQVLSVCPGPLWMCACIDRIIWLPSPLPKSSSCSSSPHATPVAPLPHAAHAVNTMVVDWPRVRGRGRGPPSV